MWLLVVHHVCFCVSSVNDWEFTFFGGYFHDPVDSDVCSVWLLVARFSAIDCNSLSAVCIAPWMRRTVVVVRIEMFSGTWCHQTLIWPWYQMDWIQCFFPWMSRPVLCTSSLFKRASCPWFWHFNMFWGFSCCSFERGSLSQILNPSSPVLAHFFKFKNLWACFKSWVWFHVHTIHSSL